MEEGVLEGSWRSKDVIGWHFDWNERSSGVRVGVGFVEGDSGESAGDLIGWDKDKDVLEIRWDSNLFSVGCGEIVPVLKWVSSRTGYLLWISVSGSLRESKS